MAKRFDAIYARQSVDKKDSVSIETQIEACRTKCDKNPVINLRRKTHTLACGMKAAFLLLDNYIE